MKRISLQEVTDSIQKLLVKFGYPEQQRPIILDVLLYAILRGNLQFIIQVCAGNFPHFHGNGQMLTLRETPLSMRVDGKDNYGIIVMEHSMRIAIQKAKQTGFGIVSSFHSAPPGTGALGYYAEKIATEGFLGFALSGSGKQVAMEGSTAPVFGSNPIAIGLPTRFESVVIDFSTAVMPVFKVFEASFMKESLHEEGFDAQGNPSFEPAMVLRGALRPFGGYKGSALALAIETLTAPLTGAFWIGKKDVESNWGNLIYAIDPDLLIEKEIFFQNMSEFMENLHHASGVKLPGERSRDLAKKNLHNGFIELEDRIWAKWEETIHHL